MIEYLKDKQLIKESNAKPFSPEDPDNVVIGCALSAISYEVYPHLIEILKCKENLSQKIKVLDVLTSLVVHSKDFIFGMNRYEAEIIPSI